MATSTLPRSGVPPTPAPPRSRRLGRLISGDPADPRWARPSLIALLVGTFASYLVGLSANGYGNSFYAAAVQAGSVSWKAFFFGSSDAGNSITVDKTPASLWFMEISVRLFGLNSWAILVPQVLMGVGTVALVVAAVRRTVGRPGPALIAGLAMALTPVAVLMFRFDNPDALLVLLLTAAGYALVRAMQSPRALRWMVLAGALVGFAFLAKMLQAVLVLPGFAVVYLVLGPGGVGKRLLHLLAAGAAMVVSAGWWIAIVQLWPADSRPYIGGSTNDSILELALGYNGVARLSGSEGSAIRSGDPGLLRLFGSELAGQISWLLPAALVALVAGLVCTARRPRTDRLRAGLAVWGGWLLVTALVFSVMAGTFHAYYTVALAPAIAALAGIGSGVLWERRASLIARGVLGAGVLLTAAWSFGLMSQASDYLPWLRWVVLVAGIVAGLALVAVGWLGTGLRRAAVGLALVASLAGPTAWSVNTITTAHTGSIPTAGPTVSGSSGMGGGTGGGPGGFDGGGFDGGGGQGGPGGSTGSGQLGTPPSGGTSGTPGGTTAGMPGTGPDATSGDTTSRSGGGMGSSSASSQVTALLEADADSYTWVAATTGSQSAATYQLATEDAVMPIGGFTGSDDSPTLAEFQQYVADGEIHYYIGGGQGGMGGGDGSSSQIASWVAENFTAQTVDGVTVYDLTS